MKKERILFGEKKRSILLRIFYALMLSLASLVLLAVIKILWAYLTYFEPVAEGVSVGPF